VNKIAFPLKPSIQSPAVAGLHAALTSAWIEMPSSLTAQTRNTS
jgi:hypothetical protein